MTSAATAPGSSNWDVVRSLNPTMPYKEIFLLQGREQVYSGAEIEAAEQNWLQEQYLEIAYLRPQFDYDGWHLWLWDADDPSSTGREVAPLGRAAVDVQHPHVEALVFRIDRGWFGPAQKLGFFAKKRDEHGAWTEQDGPDRLWVRIQGVPRVVSLQGRAQLVQSVEDFVLEVTPYFDGDRLELCFPFPPWWKRLHQRSNSVSEMDAPAAENASSAETDVVEQAARRGQHFQWQGRAPTREPTQQQMQRHSSERVQATEDDLLEALEVTMYWMPAVPVALTEDSPCSTVPAGATDHPTESRTPVDVVASSPIGEYLGAEESTSRLTDRFRHWGKNRKQHPRHRKTRSVADSVANELASITERIKTPEPALPRIVRVRAGSNPLILQFELDRELDEDFPVENVMVHLRGFSPSRAAWRQYEHVDAYLYGGSLGWQYTPTSTVFRVFAPTADRVVLCLYREPVGSAGRRELPMRRIPQGVWKIVVTGDLKGLYYTYRADGANKRLYPGVEVIDPYSRCNTAHDGRGLIYGEDHTPIADRPQIPPEHTIIYEVNLRDFTIDERSGVAEPYRGKYLGLAQHGTRLDEDWVRRRIVTSAGRAAQFLQDRATPDSFDPQPDATVTDEDDCTKLVLSEVAHQVAWTDRSTCLDHVLFLGVNTLQIMPVQDFDNDESNPNDYHWGYMPVHFFSPDGWYASCTTDASRVRELKQLIDALHKAGLKVVLDMVLNHTAEDPNEFNLQARFSFNGLAPRYYYRFWPDGSWGVPEACYANGSGCGNEFRSESPMGRKFILDMLSYWATEYKVDGFRFDLMGLMDRETLRLACSSTPCHRPGHSYLRGAVECW
ncbi:hypothetical protein F1559_004927 [Cyanidiococcus yangmingshanensis]|uniref:pullulanase n=1 Tax=Cyanidiococcus yangmingshanensis TaxID=2690220 RepID=A0A7J7IPF8_9RHOD|nr:hypothetical protein F1559_004927 [Cyanidiococcus yangmingshanensis]